MEAVRNRTPAAALGVRVHSGWAAVVAVAGTPVAPTVVERRRIDLVDSEDRGFIQPYHAAAELSTEEARAFLERCSAMTQAVAVRALGAAVERLQGRGYRLAGCGLLLSFGRPTTDLNATLRSHALIHTAEGRFFREAVIAACQHHGVRVTGIQERDLYARAAGELGVAEEQLTRRVAEWGRPLGPPWKLDQKYAALAAYLALAAWHNSAARCCGSR